MAKSFLKVLLAVALGAAWSGAVKAAPNVDDKQLHGLAGAGIAVAATGLTQSAWKGFIAGCGANVIKEGLDAAGMGVPDAKDIAAGCLGAAIGAGAGHIVFVRPTKGGAQVGVALKF